MQTHFLGSSQLCSSFWSSRIRRWVFILESHYVILRAASRKRGRLEVQKSDAMRGKLKFRRTIVFDREEVLGNCCRGGGSPAPYGQSRGGFRLDLKPGRYNYLDVMRAFANLAGASRTTGLNNLPFYLTDCFG